MKPAVDEESRPMKLAFTLLLIALAILPAVAVAGYRLRRALRERDAREAPRS